MRLFGDEHLTQSQRRLNSMLAILVVLLLAGPFFVPPESVPSCAFHMITGYSCLTCGITRSLHAFSHADMIGSLRYHLFGPIVFTGMVLSGIILGLESVTGKRLKLKTTRRQNRIVLVLFVSMWFVYWAGRFISELLA